MTDQTPARDFCSYCAAELRAGDQLCWLCKTRLEEATPAPAPRPQVVDEQPPVQFTETRKPVSSVDRARERSRARLGTSRTALYMVLGIVILGVLLVEPGAAVTIAIMAAPAIIALEVATRRAIKSDRVRSRPLVVVSFILSAIVTNLLLAVAAFVALVMMCLAAEGSYSSGLPWLGSEGVIILATILGSAGALFGVMRLGIWLSGKFLVNKRVKSAPRKRRAGPAGIEISTLMLVIAELTVAIGIGVAAPGLGILLGFVLIPGTLHVTSRSRREFEVGDLPGRRRPVLDFIVGGLTGLALMAVAAGLYVLYICL